VILEHSVLGLHTCLVPVFLSSPLLSCIPCLGSAPQYILCACSVHSFPVCITSTSIPASLCCTCFVIARQILSTPCRHSGQNPHRPRRTLRPTDRNKHVKKYNPYDLPFRTHHGLLAQAAEVDAAMTITTADRLSKEYSIKGTPLLSYVHSLFFPHSFPYDFMHLIWENTIKNLILHWTGEFKGLGQGNESYELSKAIWEGIGKLTASSGATIPSSYGSRVPNIKTDYSLCTADMWSFWTLYIGPVLLWR
jgi:hypothetical protein